MTSALKSTTSCAMLIKAYTCKVPMVSFAAFVVVPYNSDTVYNVDDRVFKPVWCVSGYGYDPRFQLRDVAVYIALFPVCK